MSITINRFKSTIVGGTFSNIDNGDNLASGYFKRDLTVDGNIICTSLDEQLLLKSDQTYVDEQLLLKPDTTYVDNQLLLKADQTDVNDALELKADITYVDDAIANVTGSSGLGTKADKTYVDDQLLLKSDTTYVDSQLLLKSNKTYVDNQLLLKSDKTYVDDELVLKADITYVDDAIANVTGTSGLGTKADKTYVDGQLLLKSDKTYVDDQVETLADQISATNNALNFKANLASPTFTGTVSGITKAMIGLSAADNTSDLAKPVSTATQTALNLKANLASPTFTGTVSGITKAMIGLSAVDNTADSAKPVSTAQQTAINSKLNANSGTFTNGIADRLCIKNLAGQPISFQSNTMALLTTNKSNGGGELNILTSATNYPWGQCCIWETSNTSGTYVQLMGLSKQGDLSVTRYINSPTIDTINSSISTINSNIGTINTNIGIINSNLALKANALNPSFSGTLTAPAITTQNISNTSNPIDISASPYITMMGGTVQVEPDGTVLGKAFIAHDGNNTIDSTGVTCTNLVVLNPFALPVQATKQVVGRANCRIRYNGPNYSLVYNYNFGIIPGSSVYVDKVATGVVQLFIPYSTGLPNFHFTVSASGSYDDGISGSSGLVISVAQKAETSNGSVAVGYSFKLIICRASAPSTPVDLASMGRIDVAVFW